ncbi:MAG TPA: glycosyltransferase family 39 protein [Candidatus Dormibacteraeota bacterium]|nr:glycosyltransferase family 39 protein [Candidatus Dormibacteraeota bacterium]
MTILFAHVPSFAHRLLDGDEAIYGTIAALMNKGGSLYGAGGVDNKPPGIFWIYSITFRIFGNYQMNAVHAAGFLAMAVTCVVIYFIARDVAGRPAGFLAALFYGLLTAAGNPRLLASNTEIFMMLPLSASVLLMLRRQWLWSGVLLVTACAFRQSAAVNVVLVAIALFWMEPKERRLRAAELFAGGMIAGVAAGALLIALSGSLTGFYRWTIETLTGYATTNWTPSLVWQRAKGSVVPFMVDMAVFWIAAIAVALRWRALTSPLRLMVAWLVVAMIGSIAGGHLSWHYFIQAMGPLAVLAATGLTTFKLRRAVAAAAIAGIAIPVGGWWIFDFRSDPLTYDFSPPVPQHQAVAAFVDAHTSPSDRVFIWGDWPAVYVESDREMSSRFPGFLRGFARGSGLAPNNWDTAPDVWPLLQADLAANPPALIVDTAAAGWSDFAMYPMSDYPVLNEIVTTQYHAIATVDGVVIYARNGT